MTHSTQEEFKVSGKDLVEKVKSLIKEGNVRRIIIKNDRGDSIVEFPVNLAILGTILAPILAAVAAVAAVVSNSTVVIERRESK